MEKKTNIDVFLELVDWNEIFKTTHFCSAQVSMQSLVCIEICLVFGIYQPQMADSQMLLRLFELGKGDAVGLSQIIL